MIVADTSGLLAYFDASEPRHADASAVVDGGEPLVLSPFVIAELDYLVATRMGVEAELAVLDELAAGAYELAEFEAHDFEAAADVIARYRDQEIGLANASLVVLADRYATKDLLTLDHRHFDVVRPIDGGRFRLLPD